MSVPGVVRFDDDAWYRVGELAGRLGLAPQTILNGRAEGRDLPPAAVGPRGALLFSGREVNRWLARRQQAVAPRGGRKLGEAEVAEIRRLLVKGVARRDLAARYGVSAATIAHLATGRTWKGVS